MKDRIREIAGSYFISVTLINLVIFAAGMLFRPEETFGYKAFLTPLLYGLLTAIPTAILYSEKELTIRQLLLRKAIQLLMDIVIVDALMLAGSGLNRETLTTAAIVSVSVIAVFAAVHGIEWLLARKTARQLTDQLAAFQKRNAE